MKIRYEFATGEISEIEVSEELGRAIAEMTHEAALRDRAETRRHVSLDKLLALGAQISTEDVSVEKMTEQALDRAELLCAMEQLLPQQRYLLKQVYFKGRSFADIAREEGVDRSAVRKRMERIISKLKKSME